MNGESTQLAQVRPNATAAVTAWTNPIPAQGRGLNAEITLIVVCNTSAESANFSLFHDNAGTEIFNEATALYFGKAVAAGESMFIAIPSPNSGVAVKSGGQIGVQTSVADALTFTFYGITQQVPTR